jgi:hypothetical protein
LPPSSTAQSLMNFPNLCFNKSFQRNYLIRKYYTREAEISSSSPLVESPDGKGGSSTGSVATVINPRGLQTSSSVLGLASSASELVWLTEMEKGYDVLVDAIYPHISDLATLAERF